MILEGEPFPAFFRRLSRVFFLLPCLALLMSCAAREGPLAQGGVLDLRSWNFQEKGDLRLAGEWDFYPGRLLDFSSIEAAKAERRERRVPDLWKGKDAGGEAGQGAGTYRLRILLPDNCPELALRYWTVSTSFEVEANGSMLVAVGRPALAASSAKAAYRPGVAGLPSGSNQLDLIVRVSNHEYRAGGMWRAFSLGPRAGVFAEKRRADIVVYAEAAALLFLALDCLVFFILRPKERAYLYLALFGLSIVLRVLVTGEYLIVDFFPGISFDCLIRLEYLTVAVPIPLAVLFLARIFPEESDRRLVFFLILPFALRAVFGLTLVPLPLLTRSIYVFYPLAAISLAAVFGFILIPAAVRRREGSAPILAGSLVLCLFFVNDSLASSFILSSSPLLGFGLLAFMVIQEFVLSRRFSVALDRSEALHGELSKANDRLEEENERYRVAQERLEAALAEKELLLREVHHRVKNSLQVVSSTLALQAHRAADPATVAAYASVRDRLRAISLVHEKLYSVDAGDSLDLGDYTRDLAAELFRGYDPRGERAEVSVAAEAGDARMQFCVDFGLVLSEFIANAFKYALSPGRKGHISVALGREGPGVRLRVEDDGPGFPAGMEPESVPSLGLQIAAGIAKKYGGGISLLPGPGGRIEARFPTAFAERSPEHGR
jgi:two-component sensor histidine kinase